MASRPVLACFYRGNRSQFATAAYVVGEHCFLDDAAMYGECQKKGEKRRTRISELRQGIRKRSHRNVNLRTPPGILTFCFVSDEQMNK